MTCKASVLWCLQGSKSLPLTRTEAKALLLGPGAWDAVMDPMHICVASGEQPWAATGPVPPAPGSAPRRLGQVRREGWAAASHGRGTLLCLLEEGRRAEATVAWRTHGSYTNGRRQSQGVHRPAKPAAPIPAVCAPVPRPLHHHHLLRPSLGPVGTQELLHDVTWPAAHLSLAGRLCSGTVSSGGGLQGSALTWLQESGFGRPY